MDTYVAGTRFDNYSIMVSWHEMSKNPLTNLGVLLSNSFASYGEAKVLYITPIRERLPFGPHADYEPPRFVDYMLHICAILHRKPRLTSI